LHRPETGKIGFPRGRYPVFVGLGTGGAVHYTEDGLHDHGWYYYKTLWAVAPSYHGSIRVTGHQVNGVHELRFNAGSGFPGVKLKRLVIPADEGAGHGWRYGPSDTLIGAPGCYAFEIRGQGLTEWVTFIASR
jgi:hypothetical protein